MIPIQYGALLTMEPQSTWVLRFDPPLLCSLSSLQTLICSKKITSSTTSTSTSSMNTMMENAKRIEEVMSGTASAGPMTWERKVCGLSKLGPLTKSLDVWGVKMEVKHVNEEHLFMWLCRCPLLDEESQQQTTTIEMMNGDFNGQQQQQQMMMMNEIMKTLRLARRQCIMNILFDSLFTNDLPFFSSPSSKDETQRSSTQEEVIMCQLEVSTKGFVSNDPRESFCLQVSVSAPSVLPSLGLMKIKLPCQQTQTTTATTITTTMTGREGEKDIIVEGEGAIDTEAAEYLQALLLKSFSIPASVSTWLRHLSSSSHN